MQKLCEKQGNEICINCDNPNKLLCKKEVAEIVDFLRTIILDIPFGKINTVLETESKIADIAFQYDISIEEVKKLLNI